jgi:hypothetical protein
MKKRLEYDEFPGSLPQQFARIREVMLVCIDNQRLQAYQQLCGEFAHPGSILSRPIFIRSSYSKLAAVHRHRERSPAILR